MKLSFTLNADNSAFGEGPEHTAQEAARILSELVAKLKNGEFIPTGRRRETTKLKDAHGNTVGFATWEDE